VAGFFQPDPQGVFELALGATTLPQAGEVKPELSCPAAARWRGAAAPGSAAAAIPIGWTTAKTCCSTFQLIECCGGFAWAPDALVHFRPRSSLGSFFRQYYRYARGDGKADLWRKRHAIRYLTYLIALPVLLALSVLHSPLWLLALLAGVSAYCWRPMRRLTAQWQGYRWPQRLWALLLIPLIRLTGDVAKMLGYPAGLRWRRRNRAQDEIHWRRTFASRRRYG
jgi:hypothetical protein